MVEGDAAEVEAVAKDMVEAGWTEDVGPPPLDTEAKKHFSKPGTGIFGGWSDEEGLAFVNDAHGILEKHGVTRTWHVELEPMDLL